MQVVSGCTHVSIARIANISCPIWCYWFFELLCCLYNYYTGSLWNLRKCKYMSFLQHVVQQNISVFAAQTYDTNDQKQFSMICETIPPAAHHLANRHAKLRLVGLCGPTNPSAGCFCSAGGNSSWHRMFSLCSDFVLPSDLCNRVIVQFWNLITRGLLLIKKRGQNKERDGDNLFLKSNLTVGSRCVWTTECRGIWWGGGRLQFRICSIK